MVEALACVDLRYEQYPEDVVKQLQGALVERLVKGCVLASRRNQMAGWYRLCHSVSGHSRRALP
jgi:hypothetical protein